MKQTLSFIFAAMMAIGLVGTASAGGPPGSIDCGDEIELCHNDFLWEISYKCEFPWEDDGSFVSLGDSAFRLAADEFEGRGDCRFDADIESDDDVEKYEVKCELPTGEKVELEVKNKGFQVCD